MAARRQIAAALYYLCYLTTGRAADLDGSGGRPFVHGRGAVICAATFSPSGVLLATAGRDRSVCVWEVASGRLLRRFAQRRGALTPKERDDNREPAAWVAFSADGSQLVASCAADAVCFWDVASGKEIRTLSWDGLPVTDCVLAMGGKRLIVRTRITSDKEVLRLCETSDGKQVKAFSNPVSAESDSEWEPTPGRLALSPDGRSLAATDHGGLIRIWDIESGERVHSFDTGGPNVGAFAFSPDGRLLAAATRKRLANGSNTSPGPEANTVRLWDVASGRLLLLVLRRQRPSVQFVAFAPDGRYFASASADGVVRVWEVASGKEVYSRVEEGLVPLCLAFSPDGGTLAVGTEEGEALVWGLEPAGGRPPAREGPSTRPDELWDDLASDDAARAYRSAWGLCRTPSEGVAILSRHLHRIPVERPGHICDLVADLGNDDFDRREAATKELAALGAQAEPALRKALEETTSAEARSRIKPLLKALDEWVVTDPDLLRALRAVWVLERIGTPEARAVLEGLAKGAPEARQTKEAKAAMDFLDKRAAAPKP